MTNRLKGMLLAVLSAACYGLAPVFGKLSYGAGCSAVDLTFWRAIMTLIGLGGYLLFSKKLRLPAKKQIGPFLLLSFVGQAATSLLLNFAFSYIGAGSAITLHFLYPIMVMLGSLLFLKQRPSWQRIVALIAAFAGVAFFFDGIKEGGYLGVILSICSSMTWAFFFLYLERSPVKDMDNLSLVFWQTVVLAFVSLALGLFTEDLHFAVSTTGLLWTAASGVVYMSALLLLQLAVKKVGAGTASVLGVFEPASGVLFGVLLLHEQATLFQCIGGGIILLSALWVILQNNKRL